MDNRYDRDRNRRNTRSEYGQQDSAFGSRQAEQFDDGSSYRQDDGWSGGSSGGWSGESGNSADRYRDYGHTAGSSRDDYTGRPSSNRSRTDFSTGRAFGSDDRYNSSTQYDQGNYGRSGTRGGSYGSGRSDFGSNRSYESGQSYDRNRSYARGDYASDNDRGFLERAGDEIASWFGDEDAARRRKADHRGKGPSGYTRSDERILEDTCDRLTEDWDLDARNIQVTVNGGEVTLDGTVDDRGAKRRAEDIVQEISGVGHVQNNLRLQTKTLASDSTSPTLASDTTSTTGI